MGKQPTANRGQEACLLLKLPSWVRGERGARGAESPAEVFSLVGCLLPRPGTLITPIMGTTTQSWRQTGVALAGLGLGLDVAAVAPRRGVGVWLTACLASV